MSVDPTLQFKPIPIPSYLTSDVSGDATLTMKQCSNFLMREIVRRIDRQLDDFQRWNAELLAYDLVDISDVKKLKSKIDDQIKKISSKIGTATRQPEHYLSALLDLYNVSSLALNEISKVYKSFFNDLESKGDALCGKRTNA